MTGGRGTGPAKGAGGNGRGHRRARPGTIGGGGGAKLRTRAWIPEDGEIRGRIVVVHGLGEHAGRYGEFADHACDRGLAVLAYDQRGHGSSEGRRGVVDRFEDFLVDLEAILLGLGRVMPGPGAPVLLGHSLGGLVALRYLQTRRPDVAGAILSAPWLGTAARVPLWKRMAEKVLARLAPELTLAAGIDGSKLSRDPVKQREYEEDPLVHDRISAGLHRAVLDAQARALAEAPPGRIPLLALVPLDDPLADADVTREYLRNLDGPVTVELYEEGRHEPLNDTDRAAVYETVADWILDGPAGEPAAGDRVS